MRKLVSRLLSGVLLAPVLAIAPGCASCSPSHCGPDGLTVQPTAAAVSPVHPEMPKELQKIAMPAYRIEPPDILVINAIRISPRPPYFLQTGDVIDVQVEGAFEGRPIGGPIPLGPGGVVDLGSDYGVVTVGGMSVEQARDEIFRFLRQRLAAPVVSVTLLQMAAAQQITGEHLVAQDGMVTLGVYGRVYVAGMTIEEAQYAIEQHLSRFLEEPEIALDVFLFNSKVYYVITEGAGTGDRVVRFPITGNETVLDAISNVNGLQQISSKRIWVARPTTTGHEVQILPVDWVAVSKFGVTETNYQILPGDRVFIAEDNLVAFDTRLAKLLTPVERLFGFSTLGVSTISRFSGTVLQGGGQRGVGGAGGGIGF